MWDLRKNFNKKALSDMGKRSSIGAELHHLDEDKAITTDPSDQSKRRTLMLIKRDNSWGFTLQTYGITHKKTGDTEIMTYVDYVAIDGAAWIAGMRKGDVILSVNGDKVGELSHQNLVAKIQQAGNKMRLVVLFEDCCRKVDLHERFIKLKSVLRSKYLELKDIERQEVDLLEKHRDSLGLNRFEALRQSVLSHQSSSSDSWDAYSLISTPNGLHSTGPFAHGWPSSTSLKSFSLDTVSDIFPDDCDYIDSDTDSGSLSLPRGAESSKAYSSDSNLARRRDAFEKGAIGKNVVGMTRQKEMRMSDSTLYRRSKGSMDEIHQHVKLKGSEGSNRAKLVLKSVDSLQDDVFVEETSESRESRALVRRNSSVRTLKENEVFYAGENGNIIVPKICIDGEEVYTRFENIDTSVTVSGGVGEEHDEYPEKIVAMEIAKDMALLEKQNADSSIVFDEDIPDAFTKSLSGSNSPKVSPKGSPLSSPMPFHNNSTISSLHSFNSLEYGANKNKIPLKLQNNSLNFLPKTERAQHIGSRLPYNQLKMSIPDIRVSFHAENYEVIYFNEKDETTKL
ncbi:uncharacterized protein LOC127848302 isoform X2 [Dreissena polymorpha]|uniref:uncharacterized protein LOC127848302 isoform X2 n=1 Tax=Dreissena polymorpha TaxID=45954 RepID=UPI0022640B75|nr:uncharacterized protein LOC127848302 isoform X2 [Dreissena polymorpha]